MLNGCWNISHFLMFDNLESISIMQFIFPSDSKIQPSCFLWNSGCQAFLPQRTAAPPHLHHRLVVAMWCIGVWGGHPRGSVCIAGDSNSHSLGETMLFSSAQLRITNTKCWRPELRNKTISLVKPVCFRFFESWRHPLLVVEGHTLKWDLFVEDIWEKYEVVIFAFRRREMSVWNALLGKEAITHTLVQLVCSLSVAYVYPLGQVLPMGEILNKSFIFLCDSPLNIWSCVLYLQVKFTPSSFILHLFNKYLIEFFSCFTEGSF